MEDNVCTKEFPKQCSPVTSDGVGSYPTYRRRNLHPYTKPGTHGRPDFEFDDSWVVPYNPWLLYKYNCHINVEICTSISAVKYLYKYIFKGHDKASVAVVPATVEGHQIQPAHEVNPESVPRVIDEIDDYVDSRYVGAQEAVWRIFGNEMSSQWPPVLRLQVHLENMQQVTYMEGMETEALEAAADKETPLTAYFKKVTDELAQPLTAAERGARADGTLLPEAKLNISRDRKSVV